MRTRIARRLTLVATAMLLLAALVVPGANAAAPSVGSCAYDASTGRLSATFTVAPAGNYAWAWSMNDRMLAGGRGSVSGTATRNATTRRGLTGALQFAVVSLANPTDRYMGSCD